MATDDRLSPVPTMNRILLIDDEEGIRDLWKRFHEVTQPVFRGKLAMEVAADLPHGIEKLKVGEFDAVILDLKFLGHGADETISFIFEHAHDPGMPAIIVLTGDEDVYVRGRCMMAGAASFWTKLDAQQRPDLFFKEVYNQYLRRYDATAHATPPAST